MSPGTASVLLIDDGELDDLVTVLNELEADTVHLRRVEAGYDLPTPRRVLITTLRRALRLPSALSGPASPIPLRVAVATHEGEEDLARLREMGFDFVLRRSLPRALLRLFLLRLLYGGGEAVPAPEAGQAPPEAPARERRRHRREPFPRRVVALHEEATQVVMARNLSRGGLFVEPIPGVRVEDEFRLALYGSQREEPILVRARVVRDEGPRGLALAFVGLDPYATQQVEKLIASLPAAAALGGSADPESGRRFVSKILRSGATPRSLRRG